MKFSALPVQNFAGLDRSDRLALRIDQLSPGAAPPVDSAVAHRPSRAYGQSASRCPLYPPAPAAWPPADLNFLINFKKKFRRAQRIPVSFLSQIFRT